MSTEAMTKEGDVEMTSCSKNTLCLFCRLLQLFGEVIATQQISFLSLLTLLHISQGPT